MVPAVPDPELRAAAQGFARARLGPASERLVASEAVARAVAARVAGGTRLEDAVLAEVHGAASTSRELANEFLAHFLTDLLRTGRPMISPGLHRFLDTWDLAQSVLGDLWPELGRVRFENRARFISLLAQRLSWKAAGRARDLHRVSRREDLRTDASPEELEIADDARTPLARAGDREDRERMILVLARLSERDSLLLRLHLSGESVEGLMRATGLGYEAARKALQRAMGRARRVLAADTEAGGTGVPREPDLPPREPGPPLREPGPPRAPEPGPRRTGEPAP